MKFNAKKCKHLVMTKKNNFMHKSWNLNGSQVAVVSIEKDLGVHVSSSLPWNDNINLIISKANNMFDITYRTCTTDCDQNTLLTLSPYTKENISTQSVQELFFL